MAEGLSVANGRDWRYDAVRLAACAGVVVLHTTGVFPVSGAPVWSSGTVLHMLFRSGPSLFIAIAGYFSLSRGLASGRGFGEYFGRRILRIVVPTLAWSVFYSCLAVADRYAHSEPLGLRELARSWLFSGKPGAGYHLWFLYVLVVLDFLAPAIRWSEKRFGRKACLAGSIALYVAYSVLTTRSLLAGGAGASGLQFVPLGIGYLPVYYWGYVFGDLNSQTSAQSRNRRLALGALSLGVIAVSTSGLLLGTARLGYDVARSGFFPMTTLQCFGWFALAAAFAPEFGSARFRNTVSSLGRLTFGIYLIHVAALALIPRVLKGLSPNGDGYGTFDSILLALGAFALSTLCAWVMSKIPLIRRFV